VVEVAAQQAEQALAEAGEEVAKEAATAALLEIPHEATMVRLQSVACDVATIVVRER
jgi:hypothetical protein